MSADNGQKPGDNPGNGAKDLLIKLLIALVPVVVDRFIHWLETWVWGSKPDEE